VGISEMRSCAALPIALFLREQLGLHSGQQLQMLPNAGGEHGWRLRESKLPCSTSLLSISLQSREDFTDSGSVYHPQSSKRKL
jgi:hypothetical protein